MTIANKLDTFDFVYIKSLPFPSKLAVVEEIFQSLDHLGVREIEKREKIEERDLKNPDKIHKIMIIRWDLIPRIIKYKEELRKENGNA